MLHDCDALLFTNRSKVACGVCAGFFSYSFAVRLGLPGFASTFCIYWLYWKPVDGRNMTRTPCGFVLSGDILPAGGQYRHRTVRAALILMCLWVLGHRNIGTALVLSVPRWAQSVSHCRLLKLESTYTNLYPWNSNNEGVPPAQNQGRFGLRIVDPNRKSFCIRRM